MLLLRIELKFLLLMLVAVLVLFVNCDRIFVNSPVNLRIIEYTSEVLCQSRLKTVYVYFENKTSLGFPGQILRELNQCGISHVSIRNKFKTPALEVIKDDGVLMYLVIIIRDVSQNLDLSIIQKKSAAKHLSHALMLIEDPTTVTDQWMRATFRQFWKLWMLNIVIIFWRNQTLEIYRYNPFTENYLIKMDYKPDGLPKLNELFPKFIPNMQGKPLYMCMYPDNIRAIFDDKSGKVTGNDGLMSAYIAKSLNATRIIHWSNPYDERNMSLDICFDEVKSEQDDIGMNIRFLSLTTFAKHVESTIVHRRDDLCVLVPKAKTASIFWNLFRSFHGSVWLAVLMSVLLTYGFCLLTHRSACVREILLLQLFAGTLTMPLTRVPRKFSLRIFLFFWLFYGILICTAFRGNLTSNLVFRTYLPDINTIQDLALSPYDLFMRGRHEKHLNLYLNEKRPYELMLKKKMHIVPDSVHNDYVQANNLSNAYLEKFHVAAFQANARRHNHLGRPLYHVMDTCIVPFHAVFIVPYGSPYLGFINSLIRRSYEFGFTYYWDRKMNAQFIKSGRSVLRNRKSTDDPVVLKLAHFQAAFCLLFIGYFLSLMAFLWEYFEYKRNIAKWWSKSKLYKCKANCKGIVNKRRL